jgi:hypothetical protein
MHPNNVIVADFVFYNGLEADSANWIAVGLVR